MAKKRSSLSRGRDLLNVASGPAPLLPGYGVHGHPMPEEAARRAFSSKTDARRWSPDPPITRYVSGRPARVIATPLAKPAVRGMGRSPMQSLSYAYPHNVVLCIRRGVRKEVLHALGVAGRRGIKGKGGTYKRRPSSFVRC